MWAVTVTGAPKTWAMQFIEDHEGAPRRWYGGAVGMIGFDGAMNTGLTLRTAHIRDGVAAVRAGATLLFDSDPRAEERETEFKARALLETLAEAGAAQKTTVTERNAARRRRAGVRASCRAMACGYCSWITRILSCTPWPSYFREQGAEVATLRAGLPPEALDQFAPDLVVLSPGPGRPSDFGCDDLLAAARRPGTAGVRRVPGTAGDGGACRGGPRAAPGARARQAGPGAPARAAAAPAHGSPGGLLAGLPQEFTAARYHSLHAVPDQVKGGFEVTAVTQDGVVMAIEDEAAGRWAVQFHPESILTASGGVGHQVIANVLRLCRDRAARTLVR